MRVKNKTQIIWKTVELCLHVGLTTFDTQEKRMREWKRRENYKLAIMPLANPGMAATSTTSLLT